MKPNFALDFRNDAITLLHRTPRGWHMVGQVPLDTPDLAEALSYLRATALGLSPKGLTTKLVIPNDQILYTVVTAPAADRTRRRKQVARGLEGRTPYDVADLAFDMAGRGQEVQVAVIAKETLAEAEGFAVQHRFNPVAFVAVPDVGAFPGEPWFGPTAFAATLLAEGEAVERDQDPIERPALPPVAALPPVTALPPVVDDIAAETPVTGMSDPVATVARAGDPVYPEAVAPEAVTPEAVAPTPVAMDLVSFETAAADVALPADAPPDATPRPAPSEAAARPPEPTDVAEPDLPEPHPDGPTAPPPDLHAADLEPEEVLARTLTEADLFASDPPPAPPFQSNADPEILPDPPPMETPSSGASPDAEEAPMALDVVDDLPDTDPAHPTQAAPPTPPASPASVLDASIPDDLPPPPAASIMMAFASRRAAEAAAKDAAKSPAARAAGPAKTALGKAPAPTLGAITASRTGPAPKVTTLAPRPGATVVALPPRPAQIAPAVATAPIVKPQIKGSATGKALRGLGALVTAPGIAGAKDRRVVAPISTGTTTAPTGPTSAATAAAATLTRPPSKKPYSGGLGSKGALDRGKPRYLGLILTGILLVFLALVAAWSNFFLASQTDTATATEAVVQTLPQDIPAPEDEMLADGLDPADLPARDAVADLPEEPAVTPPAVTLPVETAPATNLGTEAAMAVAPSTDPQDEIFLAAMDAPPEMTDALSLPAPAAQADRPPATAPPPPPFGTVYQFDADGQIVPTPEGIMTPEGVMLFAGPPKLVPPPRPAAAAAAAQVASPARPGAVTEPVPAQDAAPAPAFADPALAGARPRPRPDTLVPPTLNADDDASLAPAADSRFASLRPRARPVELARAAAALNPPANPIADLGAQAASLTAQANAAAVTTSGRSPLAIMVSRKPVARPKDMSRAVEAAVAIASRQPDPPRPPEEPAARTEPEADDEPEVAKAMPRLPTRASVAKQATFVNAINLSKVNLIGVYGTQSNRYALIRQTNGRYKKVKVGDSFDGGRVAAITASEVRYQKSGKILTLALPKG